MKIGNRIAELRRMKNMTQEKLAEEAGISISYLSKIESGFYPRPHMKTIIRIANSLGVAIEDLIEDYMK